MLLADLPTQDPFRPSRGGHSHLLATPPFSGADFHADFCRSRTVGTIVSSVILDINSRTVQAFGHVQLPVHAAVTPNPFHWRNIADQCGAYFTHEWPPGVRGQQDRLQPGGTRPSACAASAAISASAAVVWNVIRAARSGPIFTAVRLPRPSRSLSLAFHLGQQLLAPERRHHATAAARVAGLGPEWQPARDCALAIAERAIEKFGVTFTFTWHGA